MTQPGWDDKGRFVHGTGQRIRSDVPGRCVDPAQSSLLNVTSDNRIVLHIVSVVDERADCARDLRESAENRLIAWWVEMLEILSVVDVRDQ